MAPRPCKEATSAAPSGEIGVGSQIEFQALVKRADLNGKRGTVASHDEETGRYEVKVKGPSAEMVRCKAEHIKLAEKAAPRKSAEKAAKAEAAPAAAEAAAQPEPETASSATSLTEGKYEASKPGGTSKYRGVTKHKNTGRWQANEKGKYIGLYDTEEAAAEARWQYLQEKGAGGQDSKPESTPAPAKAEAAAAPAKAKVAAKASPAKAEAAAAAKASPAKTESVTPSPAASKDAPKCGAEVKSNPLSKWFGGGSFAKATPAPAQATPEPAKEEAEATPQAPAEKRPRLLKKTPSAQVAGHAAGGSPPAEPVAAPPSPAEPPSPPEAVPVAAQAKRTSSGGEASPEAEAERQAQLEQLAEASAEEEQVMPQWLRTFHSWLLKRGSKQVTADGNVRQLRQSYIEDRRSLDAMATKKYFELVKLRCRQRASPINMWIEFLPAFREQGAPLEPPSDHTLYRVPSRAEVAAGEGLSKRRRKSQGSAEAVAAAAGDDEEEPAPAVNAAAAKLLDGLSFGGVAPPPMVPAPASVTPPPRQSSFQEERTTPTKGAASAPPPAASKDKVIPGAATADAEEVFAPARSVVEEDPSLRVKGNSFLQRLTSLEALGFVKPELAEEA